MRVLEFFLAFWLILFSCIKVLEWSGVLDEAEKMKDNVGIDVSIENSTYTIVDYNSWNGTYTLSNGLVISEVYFEMINKTEEK